MTPKLLKKIILSIALVIIIVIGICFAWRNSSSKSFTETRTGISFSYAPQYTLVEQAGTGEDGSATTILWLYSEKGRILIVPTIMSIADAEKEKKFYETTLFGNAEQVSNTHEAFGDYVGFKSVVGFDHLFYTLYRPKTATSTLILRTEIIASSTEMGVHLDNDLKDIFYNLNFIRI